MHWSMAFHIAGLLLLAVVLLAGLIAIPLGLGGNFILFGAALIVAVITRFQVVPLWSLGVMAALVALGEILEALLGSLLAKRYGASRWGMLGAFAGGLAGAALGTAIFPVIGTVLGSFAGAAAGAILFEWMHRRRLGDAAPAGWGAFLGKLLATGLKVAIGLSLALYLVIRVVHRIRGVG